MIDDMLAIVSGKSRVEHWDSNYAVGGHSCAIVVVTLRVEDANGLTLSPYN